MKPLQAIVNLNRDRYGLDFDKDSATVKLTEELSEFIEAEEVDDQLDALLDIIVIAAGEITKLGYNPELSLKQVVKHIASRRQDPDQAAEWQAGNREPGEKWLKDKSQPQSEIYQPDFSTCKL